MLGPLGEAGQTTELGRGLVWGSWGGGLGPRKVELREVFSWRGLELGEGGDSTGKGVCGWGFQGRVGEETFTEPRTRMGAHQVSRTRNSG